MGHKRVQFSKNHSDLFRKWQKTHAQVGIKDSKYIPHLFTVAIPLGVYISWLLGT